MSANSSNVHVRRSELLARRAEILEKISPGARRGFEWQQRAGTDRVGLHDAGNGDEGRIISEIEDLIAEAQRVCQDAESNRDVRVQLRALDTKMKGVLLLGRATGEIGGTRRSATATTIPSREEGIDTASDLLLALATPEEIVSVIARLERRRVELISVPAPPVANAENVSDPPMAPAVREQEEITGGVHQ